MTTKQFIEKALQGGYDNLTAMQMRFMREGSLHPQLYLLDPKAWQAVGKVEGWGNRIDLAVALDFQARFYWDKLPEKAMESIERKNEENRISYRLHEMTKNLEKQDYRYQMHRMIDALCEGRSIEHFLETL